MINYIHKFIDECNFPYGFVCYSQSCIWNILIVYCNNVSRFLISSVSKVSRTTEATSAESIKSISVIAAITALVSIVANVLAIIALVPRSELITCLVSRCLRLLITIAAVLLVEGNRLIARDSSVTIIITFAQISFIATASPKLVTARIIIERGTAITITISKAHCGDQRVYHQLENMFTERGGETI